MLIRVPPSWHVPESAVTAESTWRDRRRFISTLGAGAASLLAVGCSRPDGPRNPLATIPKSATSALYPAARNPAFGPIERSLTQERIAAVFNNFYEFGTDKAGVWKQAGAFRTRPWTVEVTGLCARPATFDVDDLVRQIGIEERIYRFRCVEAWSMVVPWTGFPLAKLLRKVEPTADARYLRLVTADRPEEMPGAKAQPWFPWPYYEALSLAEANHPLALLATGIYGHELPKQHGAPIRLVVPWKYGFKSIKSVVRLELMAKRPPTFWNALQPHEYPFDGNVNPRVPHPRWSQASERILGTGERIPTLVYNGYAEQVAGLYRRG